jgi:hypothetical protein
MRREACEATSNSRDAYFETLFLYIREIARCLWRYTRYHKLRLQRSDIGIFAVRWTFCQRHLASSINRCQGPTGTHIPVGYLYDRSTNYPLHLQAHTSPSTRNIPAWKRYIDLNNYKPRCIYAQFALCQDHLSDVPHSIPGDHHCRVFRKDVMTYSSSFRRKWP